VPLNLDSCIAGIFTPGNIGASSGLPPVQPIVPSLDGEAPAVAEAAAAADTLDFFVGELLHEAADAIDTVIIGLFPALIDETALAADTLSASVSVVLSAAVVEATAADSAQDAALAMVSRSAMLPGVFVNSDGTAREANANGVMVNL
jgi:hypothetical protein